MALVEPAARRYAQAAFELALERGTLDVWLSDMVQIAAMLGHPQVTAALENSRVSQANKTQVVDKLLGDISPLALNFARLMVRKGRAGLAPQVLEEFKILAEDHKGIVRAKARTAVALSDIERQALLERLRERTGKDVVLETEVDPSLLGGVVIQIGDRLIDASTRTRLENLRETLVGSV